MTRTCLHCPRSFTVKRNHREKFCSEACRLAWLKAKRSIWFSWKPAPGKVQA